MILIFKYLSIRASGKINVKAKPRKLLQIKMAEKKRMYPTGINKKDTINHPVRHIHIQAS